MNNASPAAGLGDPSSSSPSASPLRPSPASGRPIMPAVSPDDDTGNGNDGGPSALHPSVRARDKHTVKKTQWLDHLLRNLDIVTYCHFSYLYFLDISFVRFLVRAIVQINLFAQRPPNFPTPQRSQKRSAVISIFGSTFVCFLFHVFSEAPSASEATGGYLHGGMIIDFVGQEGPVSKFRLAFLDILILLLQLTMLAVKVSKQDLLDSSSPNRGNPAQDLDSEERGVNAALDPDIHEYDDRGDSDVSPDDPRPRRTSPEDNIPCGETIIADLRIFDTVRSQWQSGGNNNSQLSQSTSAAMAANLANARLHMLLRRQ
ncbi:hypothetical protein Dda_7614 [Drechslerella dactyloides]|uniref:DUF1746 domain-containing protein n=1 Tax=Drechslerella dactyloides TaxID=74499 RepID=A0AAD6ISH9_DREDA|nr:hypothetical protein Dda_7614 [Drechslerella dactyloides]